MNASDNKYRGSLFTSIAWNYMVLIISPSESRII